MKILRAADHRRMAWKNGGGETTEIAVFPESAGLDNFAWRVSMARVDASGPFSLFPGLDRTLAILDGEGILLFVEGRVPLGLTRKSEPMPFPADLPTKATLLGGPVTDLNVMTRRGDWSHSLVRLDLEGTIDIPLEATKTIVLCISGQVTSDDATVALAPLDAVVFDGVSSTVSFRPDGKATIFVVQLFQAA